MVDVGLSDTVNVGGQVPVPATLPEESILPLPDVRAESPLPIQDVPYAKLVLLVMGSGLMISVVAFNVAAAFGGERWGATFSTLVAAAAAAALARGIRSMWRQIRAAEREGDAVTRRRHNRLRTHSAVIVILMFVIAAMAGEVIGRSGAESVAMTADLNEMGAIGSRISVARNAAEATVPSHVQMYSAIERDVRDLELILRRLTTELAMYIAKLPSQRDDTSKTLADVNVGLRRMQLLRRQIDVSKNIAKLDADLQLAAWQEQMQPILDEEEALDKPK
ncbi:MAG TPA: hypothetical protein VKB50_27810 [Vicinamibacterales bacterium]|nr:hypothetical protein [Vicinamibacterales bacterium]